ncbi:MAG TPA: cytidylate kinase-like family protein [Acidobacteriaceae bacterium]|nr:cytidylate kinase-like family protein [Acidobacteriaceae bacterium]
MVRVITVEREYGSRGAEFARQLAQRLGWELVDNCLVEEIAKRANVPAALAAQRDERLDPWYHRVGKAFWHGSSERVATRLDNDIFDAERVIDILRTVLEEKAQTGNCVIVGRGAASTLNKIPGCFHIFVYASMARKIRWFEETFPDKASVAEQELLATDRRRSEYIQRFHRNAWNDYRMYHLMLNSCMGFEAMLGAAMNATGLAHKE